MDSLSRCTIIQLKEYLKNLNLPTSGSKVELIARLAATDINSWLPNLRNVGTEADTACELQRENTNDTHLADNAELPVFSDSERIPEFVRRELDLLRREKELLERELMLMRRDQNCPIIPVSVPTTTPSLHVREISDLLPDFSGEVDAFDVWKARAEFLRTNYSLDENTMKALLSLRMKGKAQTWFHSKASYLQLSVSELFEEMHRMFNQRPNQLILRRNFEKRTWKVNETFTEYFHDKLILANKASISHTELVDYGIDGIPDVRLREQARMQRFRTANDLLEAFATLLLDPGRANRRYEERSTENRREGKAELSKPTKEEAPRRFRIQCYKCGEVGHLSTTCRRSAARGKGFCFRCGSKDHQIKDCPKEAPKDRPTAENTTSIIQPINSGDKPYIVSLKYSVTDACGNDSSFKINALIDSGSPISLIKEEFVPFYVRKDVPCDMKSYHGLNGSELKIINLFQENFTVNNVPVKITFHVVPTKTMSVAALLGRDFMAYPNICLSLGQNLTITKGDSTSDVSNEFIDFTDEIFKIDCYETVSEVQNLNINPEVDRNVSENLKSIYANEYLEKKGLDPIASNVEMVISLTHNQPISFRPRRLSYSDKEKLKIILDQLLVDKVIQPSESPYASPIVLVHKKNGELRLCVDYRELNKITVKDNYPTPLIDDHLDRLRDKCYFSCLDLKSGFHHVKVSDCSVKFTSFITPLGQFEYLRMPFGLTNAPRVFQRFINHVFSELIQQDKILLYVDDILIATTNLEEHLEILQQMFGLASRYGLTFRLDKCSFLFQEIKYLGYIVNQNGIRPSKENVESVLNYPIPRNNKDVHRFVSLASYFRRFIKDFSSIAKPLYNLIKKDIEFRFGLDELKAFEFLKNRLASYPILALYSPKLETELHCDASSSGFGAILMQRQSDGVFKPVFFFSKRTSNTETRYHSFELECLAVVYAIKRFHIYLAGIPFKILTDCDSFRLTLSKQSVNPRISRWALFLQAYNYTIEHRPNAKMSHVDALSRCYPILVLESTTFDRVLSLKQDKDEEIRKIRDQLEKFESKRFELRDGLVYRKWKDGKLLFYVPACLENNVIRTCHDELGHLGRDKVIENVTRVYWFPKMHSKISEYIANCLKCVEFAPISGKQEGFLHPLRKGSLPFQTVHVDHLGPLQKTSRGYKHILLIVDGFTKFIRLYPCKSTTSEETIKHLNDYFRAYSKPKRLISDRGTCFTSAKFLSFLKDLSVEHVLVAVNTPRANGQAERLNRVISPMLSKLSDGSNQWDRVLDSIEYALNNTISRSTRNTPSKLLFGMEQFGHCNDKIRETLDSFSEKNRDFSVIRDNATSAILQAQKTYERNYNEKRKPATVYKEGDYVVIKNIDTTPGVNKKLIPKFKGPYVIKRVLDFDRYVVSDVDGFQITRIPYNSIVSSDQMKYWNKD